MYMYTIHIYDVHAVSGKLKLNCIQSTWEQDNGIENRPKCPAIGSLFPHPCIYVSVFLVWQLIVATISYSYSIPGFSTF